MSPRWLFFPTPASGETVLDTYTQVGQWIWRSSNGWWNNIDLALDSGAQVRSDNLTFSASDPGSWPATARIRLTVTPSSGGPAYAVEGSPTGAGDSRWYWRDSSGATITLTTAEMEDGGTFGWDASDTITIEIFTP